MPTIDLSQLPPPDVIEPLDFEALFAERKAALVALTPPEQRDALSRTLALESEPITKLLQENAYRELLLRQRINEAARAAMVAFAQGADLDQLGANNNVSRLVLQPADNQAVPPVPAVLETDADFRVRIPQAFEGLSVAGPIASYEYYARSADGRVADASVISPAPACVTVSILSRDGNGAAGDELIKTVSRALNDEDVRPVADRLTVQSARIVEYEIDAVLYLYPTPEYEPILQDAKERLARYTAAQHRIGRDIVRSAIFAALHVPGVQRVDLKNPARDMILDKTQASFCTQAQVIMGGSDE
ncbi:Baseplate assembly protein J (GpJ) [Xenorhabdus nematophila ATCC 19061]|uniref:Baseplate assembly protein J (GpJ) n=1 Tax=Xenorhabdus nematophila (strain ATCC 19061 / DSM 3370 / CCUG 14189 / LMG 1036 / NCIMB 9965 / AN6) TaxID=406817 RepID=D3VKL3_XENNA|nr:baseplate J/gp47 family protein [Xenorhabdus nematophila]CBJ91121.1 Baseplate assembly protein J (GpJ) [Xenorhabdus nematophila ATCC 19061]CEK23943.1 Baseplate assembly protein J (GpJ) [Xenorhabdus nematophila AN6/1]